MKTKAKAKQGYYTHRTVADMFDIDTETLRKWVRLGTFPKPFDINRQTWLYKVEWLDYHYEHGTWPPDVSFQEGERGRGPGGD